MVILIEAQRIFRKNKHGMDFVILEALKEIQKIDKDNRYYVIVSAGDDKCLESTQNMQVIETKSYPYPIWEQIVLPQYINKINPDIVHCTSNTAPVNCKAPLVLTLHDVIFMEPRTHVNKSMYQNLGWYYRKLIVPKVIKKCKKIITVSNYEKKRIDKVFSLQKDIVVPIYNGYSNHFSPKQNPQEITKKYINSENYIFVLGNTDPKKNSAGILKAYSEYLKDSNVKLPLLLADLSDDKLNDILKINNLEHIRSNIKLSGYIINSDLPYIYSGASMFVYASFRESFGIPILEAMACGTPVITSNTSAMPEIAGDGAILIDPFNIDSIKDAMLKLENDTIFKDDIVNYGFERVKMFSWVNTAKDMLNLYKSI